MINPFDPPAPLPPAGERILDAASSLFLEIGIRAVGVDAIAEAAGTTKKTLYDRFGSKDALVAAYLLRRARRWQEHLLGVCGRRRTGRGRVLGAYDALDSWLAGSTRGCAFINAYAEYGGTDNGVIDVVRAEKKWMRAFFVDVVAEAGHPRAEQLGATVHLHYEGALVVLAAGDDPTAIATARSATGHLLDVHR